MIDFEEARARRMGPRLITTMAVESGRIVVTFPAPAERPEHPARGHIAAAERHALQCDYDCCLNRGGGTAAPPPIVTAMPEPPSIAREEAAATARDQRRRTRERVDAKRFGAVWERSSAK